MGFDKVFAFSTILLDGLKITVGLSIVMIIGGLFVGIVTAIGLSLKGKSIPVKAVKAIIRVYVELFRGSPLLLQLFFGYYGIAYAGIDLDMFTACSIVLILYAGAYTCEIIRSGIESIPKGQKEAGYSVGLSSFDVMRFVIFPQAFRIFLPTLMGFFISVIKDTSIVSLVGCDDIVKQSRTIINQTGLPIQTYTVIAVVFFAISYPLSLYVKKLEQRRAR